jgi:soluble lytic murein transglycosylase-like protein
MAVSSKGAKGLMQLTPLVYKHYGVNDPFDVE